MCSGGDCEHESHMMAEGGAVGDQKHRKDFETGINRQSVTRPDEPGVSNIGALVRAGDEQSAKSILETKRDHGAWNKPKPNLMAQGGMIEDHEESHPMIQKIMMGRMKGYSKGGMVANEESGESTDEPTMAKADGNEFDDLALRDDLEFDSTGANSGDELGDMAENHDREDIISRVMKSRSKKDRMAVPGEGSTYGRRK